jgi:hypothetical protein
MFFPYRGSSGFFSRELFKSTEVSMKEVIKFSILVIVLAVAGYYIFHLVTFLSPATDIFAPIK